MKRFISGSTLVVVVALLVLLVAGEAVAQDTSAEAEPTGTAVHINFELAPGQSAKRGHYSVQLPGGAEVASWYALDCWLDSGSISNLDIQDD